MKDICRQQKKRLIRVKRWMLVRLTQKAARHNQKRRIQAADLGMMHMMMLQISDPYTMKIQWLRFLKPRYDSQVDVQNDLSKPVTTHYLPKEREATSAKPHHMVASSNSRNSSKNMPRFTSNDMVHNHYLEEAKKRTQKQKHPRNSRNVSCVTKFLKEVNSHAKVPSNKTTNINKPVEQKCVPHKQERQIPTGHRFSTQKTSVVQKKTMTPRSCLRWKSTGKIFKTVGLRWVPTGRILTSSTTKVDNEPLNGSNVDITNQYECEQTLDVSAVQNSDFTTTTMNSQVQSWFQKVLPPADKTTTSRQELELLFHHHITMLRSTSNEHVPSQQELDLLFGPLYDEFFNAGSTPQDKQPSTNIQPTSAESAPTDVHAEENNNDQAEGEQLQDDEFTNPFCAPAQEEAESSSSNVEQVRGNPSRPVQTRRQLAIDHEMRMFALTVSTAEPKNIKEAMADSAWIEAMQEELYQFNRLQVWELVDKPFGKTIIKLKWL
nr:Gag-Pol polyprotein [Tanacetum cinerariifolium]